MYIFLWAGVKFGIRAVSSETVVITKKEDEKSLSPENWKIKMLYDGDCPLCMREVHNYIVSLHFCLVLLVYLLLDIYDL